VASGQAGTGIPKPYGVKQELTSSALHSRAYTHINLALTPGTRLGVYEVTALIGEGGMGEVYRGRDSRLNRDVAIKVLRLDHAADRDRLLREARAVSALNHPNIVTIYDVGQGTSADGTPDFIVMEFVPGRTLDAVIPKHGMRLAEALKLSVQIADALAAAHAVGIIHRDLKPGNIMVNDNGQVKLLDFGLAKAMAIGGAADGATTSLGPHPASSQDGRIAGTLSYMSPEQAEGKKLDARSDIFSFGAVLYEMLTGQRAFHGDSPASTLSAILRDEPKSPNALAIELPREVQRVLGRCLRKEADRRFQTAADLRVALLELKEESDSGRLAVAIETAPRRRRAPSVLALFAIVVAAAASAVWYSYSRRAPIAMPADAHIRPLTAFPGVEDDVALSPDGKQVAFTWRGEKQDNWDIYVMRVNGGRPLRLTTDPAWDDHPAWSPDGEKIAFVRGRGRHSASQLIVVPALGGPERVIADNVLFLPISWGPSGRSIICSTSGGGLVSVDIQSRTRTQLTTAGLDSADAIPRLSPDARTLAFIRRITISNASIFLLPLDADSKPAGKEKLLMHLNVFADGMDWAPEGDSIVYSTGALTNSSLVRLYLDGRSVTLPLGQSAFRPSIASHGAALAYTQEIYDPNIWAVDTKSGKSHQLIASTALDLSGSFSPDMKKIVFVSTRSGVYELWTCDADGQNPAQLTNFASHLGAPSYSPDGSMIAFDSSKDGHWNVYVIPSGGGAARQLTSGISTDVRPSWSPDGQWLYFGSDRTGHWQIFKINVNGGQPVVVTRQAGTEAVVSPDGQFLYYAQQNKSGLWRMALDGPDKSEVQVLDDVGQSWWGLTRDGIYSIDRSASQNVVRFYSFATQKTTRAVTLPEGTSLYPQGGRGFAISPDGRFILYTNIDHEEGDLYLVENFH
jgi:eukaryotic-like serine/threonine-protein kinase